MAKDIKTATEKKEEAKLEKKLFDTPINKELLTLYVRIFRANRRQGTSSTKTRGDVSGGGIKPWKQKGTGRARAGSRRAPHWVHGGVAHGPKPKDWLLGITSKMKKGALVSALSLKASQNNIFHMEGLDTKELTTSKLAKALKKEKVSGKALLIMPKHNEVIFRAGRNIKDLTITSVSFLNAYDVITAKTLVLLDGSLEALKKRL